MAQAGAVGVVGVAVAAQMFLKVQTTPTNKCYQPILFKLRVYVSVVCFVQSS